MAVALSGIALCLIVGSAYLAAFLRPDQNILTRLIVSYTEAMRFHLVRLGRPFLSAASSCLLSPPYRHFPYCGCTPITRG
jgi:hypothetical protein